MGNVLVAQLDRASASEAEGCRFEPRRGYLKIGQSNKGWLFLFLDANICYLTGYGDRFMPLPASACRHSRCTSLREVAADCGCLLNRSHNRFATQLTFGPEIVVFTENGFDYFFNAVHIHYLHPYSSNFLQNFVRNPKIHCGYLRSSVPLPPQVSHNGHNADRIYSRRKTFRGKTAQPTLFTRHFRGDLVQVQGDNCLDRRLLQAVLERGIRQDVSAVGRGPDSKAAVPSCRRLQGSLGLRDRPNHRLGEHAG